MSAYSIDILQKVKVVPSLVAAIRTAVDETLRHERVNPPVALSILLTDDAQLQQLNHDFRGIDKPTDVLSFAADKLPPEVEEEEEPYLGDIAISVPIAKQQAKMGGHELKDELLLLVVHGTLHLLGYDHEKLAEQIVMWGVQNAILAQLGAKIVSPE